MVNPPVSPMLSPHPPGLPCLRTALRCGRPLGAAAPLPRRAPSPGRYGKIGWFKLRKTWEFLFRWPRYATAPQKHAGQMTSRTDTLIILHDHFPAICDTCVTRGIGTCHSPGTFCHSSDPSTAICTLHATHVRWNTWPQGKASTCSPGLRG